jgi:hypothetical protein
MERKKRMRMVSTGALAAVVMETELREGAE